MIMSICNYFISNIWIKVLVAGLSSLLVSLPSISFIFLVFFGENVPISTIIRIWWLILKYLLNKLKGDDDSFDDGINFQFDDDNDDFPWFNRFLIRPTNGRWVFRRTFFSENGVVFRNPPGGGGFGNGGIFGNITNFFRIIIIGHQLPIGNNITSIWNQILIDFTIRDLISSQNNCILKNDNLLKEALKVTESNYQTESISKASEKAFEIDKLLNLNEGVKASAADPLKIEKKRFSILLFLIPFKANSNTTERLLKIKRVILFLNILIFLLNFLKILL